MNRDVKNFLRSGLEILDSATKKALDRLENAESGKSIAESVGDFVDKLRKRFSSIGRLPVREIAGDGFAAYEVDVAGFKEENVHVDRDGKVLFIWAVNGIRCGSAHVSFPDGAVGYRKEFDGGKLRVVFSGPVACRNITVEVF